MPGSALRIGLVCEDHAHRALATYLADRVILDEAAHRSADWINDESLSWYRRYCGREDREDIPEHMRFCSRSEAKRAAEELPNQIGGRPIKFRGFIDGKPLAPEAGFWRRVFASFGHPGQCPDVLVVVRDTDGDEDNLRGLEQAVPLASMPVIVATPHQEAEAWFVAGFVPRDKDEQRRLAEQERDLGFSPPEESHRLTAQPNDAATDAKRVLRKLLHDENASRPPSLEELPDLCDRALCDLALLERRGEACLLTAYLSALRTVLVPLLIPGRPPG